MVKIKITLTGEVIEVTPNVAHGLVERGEGTVFTEQEYKTRDMLSYRPQPQAKFKKTSQTYKSKS